MIQVANWIHTNNGFDVILEQLFKDICNEITQTYMLINIRSDYLTFLAKVPGNKEQPLGKSVYY